MPRQLAYDHRQYAAAALLSEMAKTRYLLDSDSPSELGVAAALHNGLMRDDAGDVQASAIKASLMVRGKKK